MAKLDRDMPEATRSPSEIKFVLRNATRKTGPEMLRDLARDAIEEEAPPPTTKSTGRGPRKSKTLY